MEYLSSNTFISLQRHSAQRIMKVTREDGGREEAHPARKGPRGRAAEYFPLAQSSGAESNESRAAAPPESRGGMHNGGFPGSPGDHARESGGAPRLCAARAGYVPHRKSQIRRSCRRRGRAPQCGPFNSGGRAPDVRKFRAFPHRPPREGVDAVARADFLRLIAPRVGGDGVPATRLCGRTFRTGERLLAGDAGFPG